MLKTKYSHYINEAGCDEAGRGCLAGPVVCAAVMFPEGLFENNELYKKLLASEFKNKNATKKKSNKPLNDLEKLVEDNYDDLNYLITHLNDSKAINENTRKALKPIIEKYALSYSVKFMSAEEVDIINVLNASLKGMQECILELNPTPNSIIIDGNRNLFPKKYINNKVGKIISLEDEQKLRAIPNQCITKGDGKFLSIAAASILAKTYRDEFMENIHNEFPKYGWDKNKGYPTKEHKDAIKTHGISHYHRKSFKLKEEAKQLSLF